MSDFSTAGKAPPSRKPKTCLTCLVIVIISCICLVALILIIPPLLQRVGVFGRPAEYAYQLAPDLVTSEKLNQKFEERDIPGVTVYVIPIKDEDSKGAFIILDESKGYQGLSPLDDNNEVFFDLLKDLTMSNRNENLNISHVTVDYRDATGKSMLSFTVDQTEIESYVDGETTREEFFAGVHFNLLDTLRNFGLEELSEDMLK